MKPTIEHLTSHILMVRPVNFAFNEQTAASNAFQKPGRQTEVQQKALQEFDAFVEILRQNGVGVTVLNDTPDPHTPDSIFPNNWVSFHEDGSVFLYPMQAENRRLERKVFYAIKEAFEAKQVYDLSYFEQQNRFLEGTGSLVLDRENKLAYACISPRTDVDVINEFCKISGYQAVLFHAEDELGKAIYHTNVLMCIGGRFAVICLDSIVNGTEKTSVKEALQQLGKEVVEISFAQMNAFAGNMLQLQSKSGESLLVMSETAFLALTKAQIETLERYCKLVHSPLNTIETNGGGSARCMMAEVFLPVKTA
ncbi:citrulline utilization hydrolase CtlX [uncultured Mucilaginibacter sp.]|uniref:citrulline utilization hydrolase CtlX n=1 Tax=uncultured Mucilaginibacter sp. TaxID=797541 RepID=UPI00263838F0|nr:arginine deiminase-related protein [uncultured Mucilaginibacter sp.]